MSKLLFLYKIFLYETYIFSFVFSFLQINFRKKKFVERRYPPINKINSSRSWLIYRNRKTVESPSPKEVLVSAENSRGGGILAWIPGASVPAVTRVHELHGWPLRQNPACAITLHRFIVVARRVTHGWKRGVIILSLACPLSLSSSFGFRPVWTRIHTPAHPHPGHRANKILQHRKTETAENAASSRPPDVAILSWRKIYIKASRVVNIGLFTDNGRRTRRR